MLSVSALLDRLDDITKVCFRGDDLSMPGQCAIFAAVHQCGVKVHEFIDEHACGSSYAHESMSNLERHVSAAVGFDADNGHTVRQHAACAVHEFASLKAALDRVIDEKL